MLYRIYYVDVVRKPDRFVTNKVSKFYVILDKRCYVNFQP